MLEYNKKNLSLALIIVCKVFNSLCNFFGNSINNPRNAVHFPLSYCHGTSSIGCICTYHKIYFMMLLYSTIILQFEEPIFILITFIKPHCIFALKKLHFAVFMGESHMRKKVTF